ncbi:MAG: alpha/beta fold hydrolase [Rhodospirillaceae bacterium]|jgi:uncharacterized protein|nr:alpha/beta fold hydrolase [Rhodospirillaceae bacterium]MBT4487766.1 alpha/beta fold hydrolase [Rhodospirillaceae bacterium]MBT5195023.1 alpha/beta fold hydrolase [Rhodospirillaceae bacterium]MBT5895175.1 alpha/beta fold hydrolase [Rhodospirillaceae bacterium]MBT6430074.1 alpha/beta fold hydrolase [Rhodospirillaceae bacterium]
MSLGATPEMMETLPRPRIISVLALVILYLSSPGMAAERQAVEIWSEGRRLAGDLWHPPATNTDTKHPAIVMTHGWGGTRSHLNNAYAPQFAAAGFIVLTFDYRGWGDSDSRLVLVEKEPKPDAEGLITVRAKPIRNVVDPRAQIRDVISAIDFISGEPSVDAGRIGLWGTSYSGGHVVYLAARDSRVKAIVAQVGYMGAPRRNYTQLARQRAMQKARGIIDPLPTDLDCIQGLSGCPDMAKTVDYRPASLADEIKIPTLIMDAENEELFDRTANGLAVYNMVKEHAPADYVLFAGTHYDIYDQHRREAINRATAWYQKYLTAAN